MHAKPLSINMVFEHVSSQKCSKRDVFCQLWLQKSFRATTACTFFEPLNFQNVPPLKSRFCFQYMRCRARAACTLRHPHYCTVPDARYFPPLILPNRVFDVPRRQRFHLFTRLHLLAFDVFSFLKISCLFLSCIQIVGCLPSETMLDN